MRKLPDIPQEEIEKRIDDIMKNMGTELLRHNEIALDHERAILEIMIRCDGMPIELVKRLAGGRVHIGDRWIDQYFKRYAAWEVFTTHDKKFFMSDLDQDNNGHGTAPAPTELELPQEEETEDKVDKKDATIPQKEDIRKKLPGKKGSERQKLTAEELRKRREALEEEQRKLKEKKEKENEKEGTE